MKILSVIIGVLISFSSLSSSQELGNDPAVELERLLGLYHKTVLNKISNEEVVAFRKCKTFEDLQGLVLSGNQSTLLYFTSPAIFDEKLGHRLENLEGLRTGDDVFKLLGSTFLSKLNNEKIDVKKVIDDIKIYWVEEEAPKIAVAPEGKGVLKWIWKLEVITRPHGRIHVGLDTRTRRFVCYENGIGIYYPEGKLLDCIRGEIVRSDLYLLESD